MACPNCCSWSVRSDRSLAGRMVCGRCGSPLAGPGRRGHRSRHPPRARMGPFPARLSQLKPGWWGLAILLALGAGLALVEPPPGRQGSPLPGSGLGGPGLVAPGQGGGWQSLNP